MRKRGFLLSGVLALVCVVVVDGVESAARGGVSGLAFSRDGNGIIYRAWDAGKKWATVVERQGPVSGTESLADVK